MFADPKAVLRGTSKFINKLCHAHWLKYLHYFMKISATMYLIKTDNLHNLKSGLMNLIVNYLNCTLAVHQIQFKCVTNI